MSKSCLVLYVGLGIHIEGEAVLPELCPLFRKWFQQQKTEALVDKCIFFVQCVPANKTSWWVRVQFQSQQMCQRMIQLLLCTILDS